MASSRIAAGYLLKRDIELIRGDTFALSVRLTIDSTPYSLSGSASVTFAMFGADGGIILKKTFGRADQDGNGYTAVVLTPEETAALPPCRGCRYEIEFCIDESTVYTALTGSISVIPDKITPDLR